MTQFLMVAVVGLMLLLPLLPASAIFYLLKTRQEQLKDRAPAWPAACSTCSASR